jgi:hypothetical protein
MGFFYELQGNFGLQRTQFAIFCINMQCILSNPILIEGQFLIYTHSLSVRCVVMVTVCSANRSVDMDAQALFITSYVVYRRCTNFKLFVGA